ncbi:uncharacterized protein TNCV_1694951 [Trichonephila clavipes]|nr:uncharacterized protein TNCV_1694951 [Trichonephila clavipes]
MLNFCSERPSSPCKHCRRMPSIGGYHPYGSASILSGLESNRACRRALLDAWCNIPQDQIDNLILSMPKRYKDCIASSERHTPY